MLIRKRNKTRRGPIRLKGDAMTQLRQDVFYRDGYACQQVLSRISPITGLKVFWKCLKAVTWDSGHLAHITSRGRGGDDSMENCVTKCAHCHLVIEHTNGGAEKIVPCKAGEL